MPKKTKRKVQEKVEATDDARMYAEQKSFLIDVYKGLSINVVKDSYNDFIAGKAAIDPGTDEGVKPENPWTTTESVIIKEYTKEMLVEEAEQYLLEDPVNLYQASMKLWAACVIALKQFVLSFGIHPTSHDSMTVFVHLVFKCARGDGGFPLSHGWECASDLHRYMYNPDISYEKFIHLKEGAINFMNCFTNLDKDKGLSILETFISDRVQEGKLKIVRVTETKIIIGRQEFTYDRICC